MRAREVLRFVITLNQTVPCLQTWSVMHDLDANNLTDSIVEPDGSENKLGRRKGVGGSMEEFLKNR